LPLLINIRSQNYDTNLVNNYQLIEHNCYVEMTDYKV
jgi:hypothetical protein